MIRLLSSTKLCIKSGFSSLFKTENNVGLDATTIFLSVNLEFFPIILSTFSTPNLFALCSTKEISGTRK
jgi:hypothetical protein